SSGATEYHYVLVDYLCRITGGELAPGDDVSAVEWVRREDLAQRQITEGTLGVIEKAFHRSPTPKRGKARAKRAASRGPGRPGPSRYDVLRRSPRIRTAAPASGPVSVEPAGTPRAGEGDTVRRA